MKKTAIILCVLLAFLTCAPALAATATETAWNEVYLPDKQVTIFLPDNYVVITKDTTSSEYLNDAQMKIVKDTMESAGNCVDAFTTDALREVTIGINDSTIYTLNTLSSSDLDYLRETMVSSYSGAGLEITRFELMEDGDYKYFMLWLTIPDENGSHYALQVGTVIDFQNIFICLSCYDGEATAEDEALMEEIWKRSVFTKH